MVCNDIHSEMGNKNILLVYSNQVEEAYMYHSLKSERIKKNEIFELLINKSSNKAIFKVNNNFTRSLCEICLNLKGVLR